MAEKRFLEIRHKIMKKINEDITKTTVKEPVSKQSKNFEKDFKKTMITKGVKINENVDELLTEKEQSLKKKIFTLPKMEALVFSDPRLRSVYDEMSENGEEKYGYHYNETIMNMIFNDYVLNSPKYLQKYKMAIPKEKKRRDKSGINQAKKAGEEIIKKMNPQFKVKEPDVRPAEPVKQAAESIETPTETVKVLFLVNEKDPQNPDLFAYFPEENFDREGKFKTSYSHMGQHSAVHPAYAKESRQAKPYEYKDLKAELESIGYKLEVLNQTNETTGSGSSGAYVGPAAWKKGGDLMENEEYQPDEEDCFIESNGWKYSVSCGGKFMGEFTEMEDALNTVKTWKQSNKWFPNTWFVSDHGNISLIDDEGNIIKESTTAASAGGAAGYVGYAGPAAWGSGDLMKTGGKSKAMRKPIWPGGTIIAESNYLTDPIGFEKYVKNLNEQTDVDYIQKHSEAFGSLENMRPEDKKIIKQDIKTGVMDRPNINEQQPRKISTPEELKAYVAEKKARGEKGLMKADIPLLAGLALYNVAVGTANRMLPMSWDDLPDINSMWDYIDKNGGMTYENFIEAVKEAVNDRLSEEGFNLDDMMGESKLNEKAKSQQQQKFMGMVHAIQKGELSPKEVSPKMRKAAKEMKPSDVEDFAKTKHKGLPEKIDENPALMALGTAAATGAGQAIGNRVADKVGLEEDSMEEGIFSSAVKGSPMEFMLRYLREKYPRMMTANVEADMRDDNIDFVDTQLRGTSQNKLKAYAEGLYKQRLNMINKGIKEDTQTMNQENKLKEIGIMADRLDDDDPPSGMAGIQFIKIARALSPEAFEGFYNNLKAEYTAKFGNEIKEDTQTMIQNNGTSMSNKATPTGDQPSNVDMGARASGAISESDQTLLEELNKELEAFSIHHDKLKLMAEDRKPSALVLRDRVGSENEKNFKKDLGQSGTKEIIDVEKELQWKDQQTDVPKDPQKLGLDIEKKEIKATDAEGKEHLKNVGDSTNDAGDEIPKRNMTDDEQHTVDMMRQGLHSTVFDTKPSERFEDRMKADMGDKVYKTRQDQMEFKGKAPMYEKDTQPIEKSKDEKTEYNKYKTGWQDEKGLHESVVTGKYFDELGKRRLIDFKLGETLEIVAEGDVDKYFELNFAGLGNAYSNKVVVNESVNNILTKYKFYTDGSVVYRWLLPTQTINEAALKTKPVVNEQMNKMKHLLGYDPKNFVNTNNVKKNRGF